MTEKHSTSLTEIQHPRQIPGEPLRRWFTSEAMDLIVWLNEKQEIQGFQLCYDKPRHERALTWMAGKGFVHLGVDDGSVSGLGHKSTPVLIADDAFNPAQLLQRFQTAKAALPEDIIHCVQQALRQHPDFF